MAKKKSKPKTAARVATRRSIADKLIKKVRSYVASACEMVTDRVCKAICPSGYEGRAGELWYARVLPPPVAGLEEHIVFTTPYVLIEPGEREWHENAGRAEETQKRIHDLVARESFGERFVTKVLGRQLGLS